MFRSGLVKSACVAILISGFSAPPASAIEMVQGSAADLNDGLISKVVVYHRGVTAVGPRGGVYHRGGTWAGRPYGGYGYRGRCMATTTAATATCGGYGTTMAATATVPMDTVPQPRSALRQLAQLLLPPIVGSIATATGCVINSLRPKRNGHRAPTVVQRAVAPLRWEWAPLGRTKSQAADLTIGRGLRVLELLRRLR